MSPFCFIASVSLATLVQGDSGRTISYLRRNLATRHPKSLALCVLLDKVSRREVDVDLDYVGFVIPDDFVVGYGLDYDGWHRNLADLAVLEAVARR